MTRQASLGVASGSHRPDASPSDSTHTFPQTTDIPRQTVVSDTALPADYKLTEAEMEEFERDDLLAEPKEAEGEELDVANILSRISTLETSLGDISLHCFDP